MGSGKHLKIRVESFPVSLSEEEMDRAVKAFKEILNFESVSLRMWKSRRGENHTGHPGVLRLKRMEVIKPIGCNKTFGT
jgi:hypothetical protein